MRQEAGEECTKVDLTGLRTSALGLRTSDFDSWALDLGPLELFRFQFSDFGSASV
jgi:hypothetical protein